MITLYGSKRSRATRCAWALEEVGAPYERNLMEAPGALKTPDYLKINPNGKAPALSDGAVNLFESLAINLYVARTYGKAPFWPASKDDQARAEMWTMWSATEAEPRAIGMLVERVFKPEGQRDEAKAKQLEDELKPRMEVLNTALAGRDWLLGKDFTVADLNTAAVVAAAVPAKFDMAAYPNVDRWLKAATARPAFAKSRQ